MSTHWEVVVDGTDADLTLLVNLVERSDIQFSRQGDQVILRANSFERFSEAVEVKAEAERILTSLSGSVSLRLSMMLRLRAGTICRIGPGYRRESHAFANVAIARTRVMPPRVTVTREDGLEDVMSPQSEVDRILDVALRDPIVERVLRLRSNPRRDWSDLYRIYEIVEHDVGKRTIIRNGWASDNELTRFARSASSVTVAGDTARHGVERQDPPPRPLTLAEANSLIDRILEKWLSTK